VKKGLVGGVVGAELMKEFVCQFYHVVVNLLDYGKRFCGHRVSDKMIE